ncbi:hypothetical protein XFF6992_530068 [Xanthomonas citri pv. fuscans]|nr:hypothetical protein XFF6992_530068 [Xanthomonas citri pv. fuscans]SOO35363.1 hypothetical protein XFF6994_5260002 [Xanthomonas citri pv. fuscans]
MRISIPQPRAGLVVGRLRSCLTRPHLHDSGRVAASTAPEPARMATWQPRLLAPARAKPARHRTQPARTQAVNRQAR